MCKAEAVPTTYRVMPSALAIVAAAAHASPDVSCWHAASGATTRSLRWGFNGCAAGHSRRPIVTGAARAVADTQERAAGDVLPTAQPAQAPEQAAEVKPACDPKVPAGQSVQAAAPAIAYVPGGQGVQAAPMEMEPAAHD